jgi:TPR repeat protein
MKAYPYSHKHPTTGLTASSEGMDLRDYLAASALQGFLAYHATAGRYAPPDDELARESYKMADAMLKARSKQDD